MMDRLEPVYTSLAYIVTFMGVSFILLVVRNLASLYYHSWHLITLFYDLTVNVF